MPLDVHKVRQLCNDGTRTVADVKRQSGQILQSFKSLGGGFTSDRLYSRAYTSLDQASRELDRALESMSRALKEIERSA